MKERSISMTVKLMALACLGALATFCVEAAAATAKVGESKFKVCDQALVMETAAKTYNQQENSALAYLITSENYDEAKHAVGISAVLYDVPVGATYSDYAKNRSKHFESHQESQSKSLGRTVAISKLDKQSGKNYQTCINAVLKDNGFYAWVESVTDTDMVIGLLWRPARGQPQKIDLRWTPAEVKIKGLPKSMYVGGTTVVIPRPTAETSLGVNGFGDGQSVTLQALAQQVPPVATSHCELRHTLSFYNSLNDSRLPQVPGSLEEKAVKRGEMGLYYAAEGGGGRTWEFDEASWGMPAVSIITGLRIEARNMSNFAYFSLVPNMEAGTKVNVRAYSSSGGAVTQVYLVTTYDLQGVCPVIQVNG